MAVNPIAAVLAGKRDALEKEISGIVSDLNAATAGERPRFAERLFVGIFLPYFAGDKPLPYPVDSSVWVARVATNPFQEVDVVDIQGQVLFTVPAMFDRSALDPGRAAGSKDSLPVEHIVKSAQQLRYLHPLHGEAYLETKLTEKALIMRVPTNILHNLDVWNKIFVRYGREPIVGLPEQSGATAAAEQPALSGPQMDTMDLL